MPNTAITASMLYSPVTDMGKLAYPLFATGGGDRMCPSSAPVFDPVEVVRGALASLSFTSDRSVHEIHTGRLQGVFSRTGLSSNALIHALEAIEDLREAERLEQGYWLPTPTRTVPLDDETCLLVSIAPTTELQRHFQSVRRAGLGRLVDARQASRLPAQSLKSWLGTGDADTPTWTRTQVSYAISELKASIAPPDLEAFSIKKTSRANQHSRHEPAWLPSKDPRAAAWNNVRLFRTPTGPRHHRYFLGRITNNNSLLEGPEVADYLRLQYGLAFLQGQPLTVSTESTGGLSFLRLPLTAPRSVRRILSALCEQDPKSFGYRWACHQLECYPTIQAVLTDLGCEIANHE